MKNELKSFFREKSLNAVHMAFEPVDSENAPGIDGPFSTNPAAGQEKQQYYNLRLAPKNVDGELTGGSGRVITKTVFSRTHPGAFSFIERMQAKGVDIRKITGNLVTIDTTRPFEVLMRDRDTESPTFGKLIRVKNRQTGAILTSSKMRIFLFEDEDTDADLTRRANQLTEEKAWVDVPVDESELGQEGDL